MTKTQFKQARQLWARMSDGLPMTPEASARIIRLPLLKLHAQCRIEIAPTIAKLRETDDFIASGQSLFAWTHKAEKNDGNTAPRTIAPPLPIGLTMPSNKCLNPAFAVA